jgi:cytidylate kinase
MLAECLSEAGGYRCISREDLTEAVNEYGQIASRVTAQIEKALQDYQQFSKLRRPYKILMKRALLEYLRQGKVVYFGNSGHLLVDKVSHFVRVRLLAPVELRVELTIRERGCSEAEAKDYIRRVDEERIRWARLMYGANVRDPSIYDLCINMGGFTIPGACDLLTKVVQEKEFQPTAESLRRVENSTVATAVLAALVTHEETFDLEIGATFEEGNLRLLGPYLDPPDLERVIELSRTIPEVRNVDYEPGYAPAFRFLS